MKTQTSVAKLWYAVVERVQQGLDAGPPKFPSITTPGAYTIIYVSCGGDVLCAECATEYYDGTADITNDPPTSYHTYDEGPPLGCSNCGKTIESSYGEVDSDFVTGHWSLY